MHKKMKDTSFCLSIDGSNDTGTEKMNPMTVKIFDVNQVQHRFLDMCTTAGREAARADHFQQNGCSANKT